jgi:hypothetical protein
MAQMTNDRVVESMLSKLKEDVKYSCESLTDQIIDSVRIDSLLKNLREVTEKNSMDQSTKASLSMIMLELQHLRDQCIYYTSNITRAAKDFNAYMHVFESLYEQNRNLAEATVIRKIPDANGDRDTDKTETVRGGAEKAEKRADSILDSPSKSGNADEWWNRYKEQKGGRSKLKLP